MTAERIFGLLATADFGAYAMSLDQTITFWNRSAQRILGYAPEQVVGRRCYEVVAGLAPGGLTPVCQHGCPSVRRLQAGMLPSTVTMDMRCASGQRKMVYLTPLVLAGKEINAPLLVHLFDDSSDPWSCGRRADSMREELDHQGVSIVSEQSEVVFGPAGNVTLSKRQLEVLRFVALGWNTPRIAQELEAARKRGFWLC